MQDFYGDTPIILQRKKVKRLGTGKKKDNMRLIFAFAVIFSVLLFAVSGMVYKHAFIAKSEDKTYFAVCFYKGTSRAEAEAEQSRLVAAGGSGYIVNDGQFKVFGAVYSTYEQAQSVVKKQQSEAFVAEIGYGGAAIKCKSYDQAKAISECLVYFDQSVEFLLNLSLKLDLYEENEASVYMHVEQIYNKFSQFYQNDKAQIVATFFKTCCSLIREDFLQGVEGETAGRLKLIIHQLIELRGMVEF